MRHIDTVKKAVVFTDIKDFTLKNSLLTQKQIREYLSMQDEIVFPIIKANNGKLVKTIGDAYMIVFNSALDAVNMAIDIQKELRKYNEKVSYNLYKIELRITINYGEVQEEETVIGEDYFGDVVNIASRLQYSIEENKIFVTSTIIDEIKDNNNFHFVYLGRTSLRGILKEIEVFEIIFDKNEFGKKIEGMPNIEERASNIFMTERLKEKIYEVNNMITELALITAIAGMDIIPYIGGYIMLPFHYLMLKKISAKFGVMSLDKHEIKTIFLTFGISIIGTYGIDIFTRTLSFTEYVGFIGYLTFLLNFILSFLIGKNLSEYFLRRGQNISITNSTVKNMFKKNDNLKKEVGFSKRKIKKIF